MDDLVKRLRWWAAGQAIAGEAADEIESLRAELEAVKKERDEGDKFFDALKRHAKELEESMDTLRDTVVALERRNLACQKDAERYRWLRKYLSTKDMPILCGRGVRDEPDDRDAIDAAVDLAAMKEQTT